MAKARLLMRVEYQKCRTWGHAWEDFIPDVGEKRPAPWGRRFSLRCVRCQTERHDVFDGRGQLSTRHYDYPQTYKLGADERPDLAQLRLSLVAELRAETEERVTRTSRKPRRRRGLVAVG